MKKLFILAVVFGSIASFTSCKSNESAYKKAYEKAMNQTQQENKGTVPVTVSPSTQEETTTSTTPTITVPKEDNSDVRTISGGVTVINGAGLKTYSVVIGSYSVQANAEGMQSQLKQKGYEAQVVKSNETINGITGWYRVVASTFDIKSDAVSSRDALRGQYPGAWLLYNK